MALIIKIFLLIGILVLTWVVIESIRSYSLLRKSTILTENSQAFERIKPESETRILVVGDSTAVGTGSKNPKLSTAGRLSELYPEAEIINLAKNGLKLEGLVRILNDTKNLGHFDIVVAQIGANDIIRFTNQKKIKNSLDKVTVQLLSLGQKVVLLHSGRVGEAPFFPFYLSAILNKRSEDMRELYKMKAEESGLLYVDLIASDTGEMLLKELDRYYAEDYLHLSDEGYGLWYEEIKKQLISGS